MVIEKSGIHTIGDAQRQLWEELKERLVDAIPFCDANKIGDEDLAYRFLIARQWNLDAAEKLLKDYLLWRQDEGIDAVRQQSFPSELTHYYSMGFHGYDKEGRPVYYERPDPKGITYLLQNHDKQTLLRWHYCVIERARERYRLANRDRLTIVLDASRIGMSLLTNTTAVGFLKEIISTDQVRFPEHMMYLFVINAPMVFSTLWNLVRPMVDERTQRKVHIWRGNYLGELRNYIDVDQIPKDFGGNGGPFVPMATDPAVYQDQLYAQCPFLTREDTFPETDAPAPSPSPEPIPPSATVPTVSVSSKCIPVNGLAMSSPANTSSKHSPPSNPVKVAFTVHSSFHDVDSSTLTRQRTRQKSDHFDSSRLSFKTAEEGEEQEWDTADSLSGRSIDDDFERADGATSNDNLANVVEALAPQPPPTLSDDLYLNPPLCLEHGVDAKGFPTIQCWHLGQFIAETRNNLVVQPHTSELLGELCLEEGHLWHVVVQLHDRHCQVRFAFMRRRLHKEVKVFLCGQRDAGKTTVRSASPPPASGRRSLQHTTKPVGERLYIMSCFPTSGGAESDWAAGPPGLSEWAVHLRGNLVFWGRSLKDHEPELMFAFSVAVIHLWHWK